MGKILAACTVTIPIRLKSDDRYFGITGVTEDVNMAIKSTARTITKTKLSDKVRSEQVLAHLDKFSSKKNIQTIWIVFQDLQHQIKFDHQSQDIQLWQLI